MYCKFKCVVFFIKIIPIINIIIIIIIILKVLLRPKNNSYFSLDFKNMLTKH